MSCSVELSIKKFYNQGAVVQGIVSPNEVVKRSC